MFSELPIELKKAIAGVQGKRAKTVLMHIMRYGQVTTEDLEKMGYAHAPRAARDVRENGIPLKTIRIKGSTGKSIAAYTFDTSASISNYKLGGRKTFSKIFKSSLIQKYGSRCSVCSEQYSEIYLQIDHRVPYEVAGDELLLDPDKFMLVCGTCNRKKSWTCEKCPNWLQKKDPEICKTCIWASPENFSHIALERIKIVELVWKNNEVDEFDAINKMAAKLNLTIQTYIKSELSKKSRDV